MKIVTWNCNGAFRKKHHFLDKFDADLLIIQECENPSQSTSEYRKWAKNHFWIGGNKHKGLGVFALKGQSLQKLSWESKSLQLFLPVRVNDAFNLVAVWTKQAGSKHFGYIGQFWKYLQLHKARIKSEKSLVCGDFNSNAIWHDHECWWNHLDVVRELKEVGLESLYHQYFGEEQGQESRPTLYLHRKIDRPYHIDYAFVSRKLFIDDDYFVEIGRHDEWLQHSDHMPVVFSINGVS